MSDYLNTYEGFKNQITETPYNIFCDMDGVLSNFEKRFKQIEDNDSNLSPDEYSKKYGKFSIWPLIDTGGVEWWSNMEWMPDGKKLWSWLQPYTPTILSAPSRNPTSKEGKMAWIKSHLNINQKFFTVNPSRWKPHYRIILNSQKHLFARDRYDILIDDTPKKVENWRAAGGTAILHTSASNTISQLKKILI